MKQLSLFKKESTDFGGSLLEGRRKNRRPLSFNAPMHLVLKSEKAKGEFALSPSDMRLKRMIRKQAQRFGVRVYSCAVNWSHIHFVIKIGTRKDYVAFVRAVTGAMVLKLRAPKGVFTLRPFTKIGRWGRQFRNLKHYVLKNELQARGLRCKKQDDPRDSEMIKKQVNIESVRTRLSVASGSAWSFWERTSSLE